LQKKTKVKEKKHNPPTPKLRAKVVGIARLSMPASAQKHIPPAHMGYIPGETTINGKRICDIPLRDAGSGSFHGRKASLSGRKASLNGR
jgi:hypothetical protein